VNAIKKRLLLGASVILAVPAILAAPALVQVASAQTASPNNWTGSYGGIAGGLGSGSSGQTDSGIPTHECVADDDDDDDDCGGDGHYAVGGGVLGGTLGYNSQQGLWVFGLEGDYSWADISGSSNVCGVASGTPHGCGTDLESLGTLRGRIGYATGATGNWLPYVTGGLAVGELRAWDSLAGASGDDFRAGWTVGAGVETKLTQNWTFKVEYLYVDLGSSQMFNIVPGVPETVSFNANIIRAGFNYKFDWGGKSPPPIVTKH
jgi:outer membrane immunogenic protein